MSTRNIYGMNPKNKLYLFERLENSETSETKDVWGHLDRGEYSIEHIILSILLRSSCLRISRHISDRRGTARAAHTSARQAAEKAILCSSSQECL